MALQVRNTSIADARVLLPDVFTDERGFFKELYSKEKYRSLGITDEFVQDNVSYSVKNVIRGLHGDAEMSKLVTVYHGSVWDVIVDVRPGSPTYGKWEGIELSERNHVQLYIPKGCAHGFMALSEGVVFAYKQSALYNPQREFAYRWDSPALGITWPLNGVPHISAKDHAAPEFTL